MTPVILESPYRGRGDDPVTRSKNTLLNILYARLCVKDCLRRGESPIASHLLFTQRGILDDDIPSERRLGIEAGLAWLPRADRHVYYTDHGWSTGMLSAFHDYTLKMGIDFRLRSHGGARSVVLPVSLNEDLERLLRQHIEE